MMAPEHGESVRRWDTLPEAWARAAVRAPRVAWRRGLLLAGLVLLAIPGALLLGNVAFWAIRWAQPAPVAVIVLHLAVMVLAVGAPIGPARGDEVPGDQLSRLATEYAVRIRRLRLIRLGIVWEAAVLFIGPPLTMLLTGEPPRWSAFFVIAMATLIVIWPLERVARAQWSEAQRLLGRANRC